MIACKYNQTDVARMLVERDPNIINQKDEYGYTGFLLACRYNRLEIIKLLIERHPDIVN